MEKFVFLLLNFSFLLNTGCGRDEDYGKNPSISFDQELRIEQSFSRPLPEINEFVKLKRFVRYTVTENLGPLNIVIFIDYSSSMDDKIRKVEESFYKFLSILPRNRDYYFSFFSVSPEHYPYQNGIKFIVRKGDWNLDFFKTTFNYFRGEAGMNEYPLSIPYDVIQRIEYYDKNSYFHPYAPTSMILISDISEGPNSSNYGGSFLGPKSFIEKLNLISSLGPYTFNAITGKLGAPYCYVEDINFSWTHEMIKATHGHFVDICEKDYSDGLIKMASMIKKEAQVLNLRDICEYDDLNEKKLCPWQSNSEILFSEITIGNLQLANIPLLKERPGSSSSLEEGVYIDPVNLNLYFSKKYLPTIGEWLQIEVPFVQKIFEQRPL